MMTVVLQHLSKRDQKNNNPIMPNKKLPEESTMYNLKKIILIGFGLLLSLSFYGQQNNGNGCKIGDLPSIGFRSKSSALLSTTEVMLNTIVAQLKENPGCSIIITAYPDASKHGQQLANDRLVRTKQYFVEDKGISSDRVDWKIEPGGGDPNTVDIKAK